MATKTKPKAIMVTGRRWFQRTYGNTYFSAAIYVDGECVHRIEKQYGYGSQYEQEAARWLAENGYVPADKGNCGVLDCWPLSVYCRENGIAYSTEVSDVGRERDL